MGCVKLVPAQLDLLHRTLHLSQDLTQMSLGSVPRFSRMQRVLMQGHAYHRIIHNISQPVEHLQQAWAPCISYPHTTKSLSSGGSWLHPSSSDPPGWVDLVQTRPRQHVARVLQAGGNSSAHVHVHMCLRPAVNTHPVADGQCGYTAHVQC